MAGVDFLHHEDPSTWAGVEPATIGAEDQRQNTHATQPAVPQKILPPYLSPPEPENPIPTPDTPKEPSLLPASDDSPNIIIQLFSSKERTAAVNRW
ncbi:hypothetical protein TNCV_4444801 [Trichonephila clavipes]|nr:hypothetical protein TNCV_4444801 [Trichonephila clavipes]